MGYNSSHLYVIHSILNAYLFLLCAERIFRLLTKNPGDRWNKFKERSSYGELSFFFSGNSDANKFILNPKKGIQEKNI